MSFIVCVDMGMFDQHVCGVVGVGMPAGLGIDEDVVVGFLGVGLDDLFVGEYVVEVGDGWRVGGLWVGVEVVVHGKIR